MPVTPGVSASQRRCFRYARSSTWRSAVKGRMFAGRHPSKRKLVMDVSSPGADGERVGDVPDRLDAAFVVDDDGDDVEAARRLPDPLQLEVSVGELREPILLARVHARLRRISLDKIAARLDLDEDE